MENEEDHDDERIVLTMKPLLRISMMHVSEMEQLKPNLNTPCGIMIEAYHDDVETLSTMTLAIKFCTR
jgi:hypothetical protein